MLRGAPQRRGVCRCFGGEPLGRVVDPWGRQAAGWGQLLAPEAAERGVSLTGGRKRVRTGPRVTNLPAGENVGPHVSASGLPGVHGRKLGWEGTVAGPVAGGGAEEPRRPCGWRWRSQGASVVRGSRPGGRTTPRAQGTSPGASPRTDTRSEIKS